MNFEVLLRWNLGFKGIWSPFVGHGEPVQRRFEHYSRMSDYYSVFTGWWQYRVNIDTRSLCNHFVFKT
jgi:hypothetical protein